MSMEILKNDIKKGTLQQVYLFLGPEIYLINHYVKEIEFMLVEPMYRSFNLSILQGKDSARNVIDSCETVPVMADKKMVIIKESGLFSSDSKSKKEKIEKNIQDTIAEYLNNLPQGVHVIFVESEVNKNSKMYRAVKSKGICVEFGYQGVDELTRWVTKVLNSYKVRINKTEAVHLVSMCSSGMVDILNEIRKLTEFVGEGNTVTADHIEAVCVKSIQGKVFEMLDAITQKNPGKAYKLLDDMLVLKEPLQKISVMVARHFKIMFFIKNMKSRGYSTERIANQLSLQPFIVNKYIRQCENYDVNKLEEAMRDCLDADRRVKTGLMDSRIALESIISKYSA